MKRLSIFAVLILIIFGCSNTNAERSEHELLSLFQKYHDEKDINKMMGLFYQKNIPKEKIKMRKNHIEKNFTWKIRKIEIKQITEKTKAKLLKGRRIPKNLTPVKGVRITFEGKNGISYGSFPIGKAKNTHYFIIFK